MQAIPFKTNPFADEENPARTDALTADARADVVIVGAGIVGLSCAYTLSQAGLDVALVERDHVGFGSSGRHFGVHCPHLWPLGEDHPEVLAGWAQGCHDRTAEMLAAEGIECGFRRFDFWLPVMNPAFAEIVPQRAKYFQGLGLPVRAAVAAEVECTTVPTHGAFVLGNQATVDPWRLARGMREAILRKGVRLYEGTPVESLEGGAEVVVKTPGGVLRARKAVVALNAHAGQFPFLRKYVAPAHTWAIATEPLDESTVRAIGCKPEDVLIDYARTPGTPQYYHRFRPDRRFYFGGGGATPAPAPDRMAPDRNDEKFRSVHAEMIRRYPVLEGVRIEAGWGGSLAATMNGRPNVLELPDHENVILAVVGNGNGIGIGTNAGRLVKGLVLGKDTLDASTRAFLEWCEGPGR